MSREVFGISDGWMLSLERFLQYYVLRHVDLPERPTCHQQAFEKRVPVGRRAVSLRIATRSIFLGFSQDLSSFGRL